MTTVDPAVEHDRTPPHDDDAERVVIGSMMLSRAAVADVIEKLQADDFYRPAHATIFTAVLDLYSRGQPTDPVNLGAHLLDHGQLMRVGGAPYLHDLVASVPIAAQAGWYADIVAERSLRRRIAVVGAQCVQLAHSTIGAEDIPEQAAKLLHDALRDRSGTDLVPVGEAMTAVLADIETGMQHGLSTGFADLDRITYGLRGGQVWIVGARPGVGKTVLLADMARTVAIRQRQPVVFFSLEMGRGELIKRILSAETRIPLHTIMSGGDRLTDNEWVRLANHSADITDAPLLIDETPGLRITDIAAKVRRRAEQDAIGLVVIDYLQLMEGVSGGRQDNREQVVAQISRGLKLLAKDLNIPIVVAAQLNRGPEQRTGHLPMLSDLRESGALESDADVVILPHRPDYYDKESERAGEADLIVAKNRGGPTDTITVAAQLAFARFVDMALPDAPAAHAEHLRRYESQGD